MHLTANLPADFYPRSPCGERLREARIQGNYSVISIHALLAESDSVLPDWSGLIPISIHALLAESDYSGHRQSALLLDFYPRSPCGERPFLCYQCFHVGLISIHALLAESDVITVKGFDFIQNFYPRSPCGERRGVQSSCFAKIIFLSTLSLRRATIFPPVDTSSVSISIHALLAESDHQTNTGSNESSKFLSTLSLRRATSMPNLRESIIPYFYPRSPCGERRGHTVLLPSPPDFYPRSPCGERLMTVLMGMNGFYFYPRSPCGERPFKFAGQLNQLLFLSTLSLRRATACDLGASIQSDDFYPRSPCGERRKVPLLGIK